MASKNTKSGKMPAALKAYWANKGKPKGKKGMAQVKKLGRNYKTGGFNKIAASAGKKYGSSVAGKKVAGAIFQKMVKKRGGK